jgi:carbonic anhydrase
VVSFVFFTSVLFIDFFRSYGTQNEWATIWPICSSVDRVSAQQSPIDIKLDDARYDSRLSGLSAGYRPFNGLLANTGHGLRVGIDLTNSANVMYLQGGALGPLGDGARYQVSSLHFIRLNHPYFAFHVKAHSFHFHYGVGNIGSENTIDGRQFPLELHLIHWDHDNYAHVNAGLQSGDPFALAVVGVMYEIGAHNDGFDSFLQNVSEIIYWNSTINVPVEGVDLNVLFPPPVNGAWDMYTFPGSLTTPHCQEVVIWNVLKQTMTISEAQLAAFQSLRLSTGPNGIESTADVLGDNFRFTQPLNGRVVRSSDATLPPLTFDWPIAVRTYFEGTCADFRASGDYDLAINHCFPGVFAYPFDNYSVLGFFDIAAETELCSIELVVNNWSPFYQNQFMTVFGDSGTIPITPNRNVLEFSYNAWVGDNSVFPTRAPATDSTIDGAVAAEVSFAAAAVLAAAVL